MKEKKKRIIGLFLALAMLITCLPLNPIAAYAAEGDVEINMINFPDSYFRDYVSKNIDTDHNKVLSQEECDKVENISVVRGYDSLKGIEYFKNLKYLDCSENGLMNTLDLSQNPALEELNCKESGINALDLSQNKALKKLNCEGSSWLETLNLGSKPDLEELTCYKCRIKALDLSQSPKLKDVKCYNNQLTELKLGSKPELEKLNCSDNQLTELDVIQCPKLIGLWFISNNLRTIDLSKNKALAMLSFGANKIEKIDLSANTLLDKLGGYENPLISLKIPDNTYSFKKFTPIKYSVKVQSGGSKVSFVVLPQGFDKNRIQGAVTGASVQDDSFTWDRSTNPITFQYQLCDNPKEVVEAQITVTEGTAIKNVYNEMPEDGYERLTFKSGNGNFIGHGEVYAIDVLRGTSYDDLGLKKQIKSIEDDLRPTDTNKEFDKWDKQVPTRGNVATETFTAVYKDKDVVKISNDPILPTPTGYTRIIFDAGDGNTIDGNRYKIIDVLENTRWDDAALRKQIPSKAIYKDASKEFKDWYYSVPTIGKVSRRSFTATYKDGKKVVLPNQENPGEVVKGRVRITFDAGEGNTIDGTHRYKYIDVLEKTNWYETDLKTQIPSKAKYKDATKEFYKWKEQVPTSGKVSTKTFTATYKDGKKVVLPNPTRPGEVVKGRVRITFDAGEGNTIDGTHRYKYIDVLENTPWTNTILTRQIPSKTTSKDATKEFDKWNEQVPTIGNVETKTFTAIYKEKVFNPANVATTLVETAENSKTEADYKAAKTAVEALTNSDGKTGLQKRLEEVKKYIDANNAVDALGKKTIAKVTEGDINAVQELINKVKQEWRQNLIDGLNIIRTDKKANDQLTEAKNSVAKAEADKSKEAYDQAKTKVDGLGNGQDKKDLQRRLGEVDKYIKADDVLKVLEGKAIADVTQREIDEAEGLIKTVKDQWQQALNDRLTTLKTNKTKQVAEDELAQAKTEAKQKVESLDKLSQEEKSGYTGRIDQAQNKQGIDSIVQEAQEKQKQAQAKIAAATELVVKAENKKTEADYNEAKTAVDALTEGSDKTSLQNRLEEVNKYILANKKLDEVGKKNVAELTDNDLSDAENLINQVKQEWQQDLKDKLQSLRAKKDRYEQDQNNLNQAKADAKRTINELDKLSQEEKAPFIKKVDDAQNIGDVNKAVLDAQKANAKKKIAGMQNLKDADRKQADEAVDNASTKDEIDQAVKDAEAKNNSGAVPTPPTPPVPPVPTPNPNNPIVDDSQKKPVNPNNGEQGTGVIVKDPDNKNVLAKDRDGNNVPAVINPNTGEIVVNPGKNVNGPITITIVDKNEPNKKQDITIDVNGNNSGRDDDNSNDYNHWYRPYWTYNNAPSTSVNATTDKKIENTKKLESKLIIGSKEIVTTTDGVEKIIIMDVSPFIKNGRTMLPIRFVAEALGFNVQWDKKNRTAILIDKENIIKIPVDTNKIIVNGKEYIYDVKSFLKNSRTMLPIGNIARALGLKDDKDIHWNENTKEVIITREIEK